MRTRFHLHKLRADLSALSDRERDLLGGAQILSNRDDAVPWLNE